MKKFVISTIVIVTIIVTLIWVYIIAIKYLSIKDNEKISEKINQNCERIDNDFKKIKSGAINLAEKLSTGKIPFAGIEDSITEIVKKNSLYTGAIVAFAPNKFKGKRLYCKYALRETDSIKMLHVEDEYDYTSDEYTWFNDPLNNGSQWNNPYFGKATGEELTEYAVPFYNPNDTTDKKPIGVVCIVKTLSDLRNSMSNLSFGKSGYPILLTTDGSIIYHPDEQHTINNNTVHNIINSKNNIAPKEIKVMLNNKAGEFEYIENKTRQRIRFQYRRVESTNWIFGAYIMLEEIESSYYRIYSLKIILICSVIIFLTILLAFILQKRFWTLSLLLTILFITGIVLICYLTPSQNETVNNEVKIFEKEGVDSYLNDIKNNTDSAVHIPTGIFVQSLECTKANNFIVKGYVWQEYPIHRSNDIDRGVIFPEALKTEITRAYTSSFKDREVIGWQFTITIREVFDYSNYPFDYCRYWIRMKHKDITKNIILTPDLKSYNIIIPKTKPGIEKEFVLPGRSIIKSYFSYRNNSYNTNLGIQPNCNMNSSPELYFNILVKRDFVNPFIAHLVPVIVIIFMLFSILQLGRKTDKKGLMGFNSMSTISACSALFFVVIFNHISLRNELEVSGIVYLEFFYIVTYLSILFVSVVSLLIAFGWGYKFVSYENALYARLSFFPVLTFALLVITALEFIL